MSKPLRIRFENFLTVRRYAAKTKEAYITAVIGLSQFYNASPDSLSNEQIQRYLQHLIEKRRLAWSTCNVYFSAFQCFYGLFLEWPECRFSIPPRPRIHKLPMLLSIEEVQRLIAAAGNLKHQALLMTVYCAGLRVSEVVNLRPHHIESSAERMMIRVEQGKGRKDRYTILPEDLLATLKSYWREYRPGFWLFPAADPKCPLPIGTAQHIYYNAKKKPA